MTETVVLASAAALLDQGRAIDRLSRLLTAAALIGLLLAPLAPRTSPVLVACAMLVALAGLAETYLAARVRFDAALFRQVAGGQPVDFTATDAALTRLGLLPAAKVGRLAEPRIAGARRLLAWQICAIAIQVLLAFICGGVTLARS